MTPGVIPLMEILRNLRSSFCILHTVFSPIALLRTRTFLSPVILNSRRSGAGGVVKDLHETLRVPSLAHPTSLSCHSEGGDERPQYGMQRIGSPVSKEASQARQRAVRRPLRTAPEGWRGWVSGAPAAAKDL